MVYLYTQMLTAWSSGMGEIIHETTEDMRGIWEELIEYLQSRSPDQICSEDWPEFESWYREIWEIVSPETTEVAPPLDAIVEYIYSNEFIENIRTNTFPSIFNAAPVSLQYGFIDYLSGDSQGIQSHNIDTVQHYAGETYGNYDSDYEPPENPSQVFDWPQDEEAPVGDAEQVVIDLTGGDTDGETDDETDDETDGETDDETDYDSMPSLESCTDDESYDTDATVMADFTDDDSDYDSMPELVSDHEDDNSARVGQRTGVMRPRSIRV
jgi:hypothetical protein